MLAVEYRKIRAVGAVDTGEEIAGGAQQIAAVGKAFP